MAFLIRFIHVGSAAFIFGGALLILFVLLNRRQYGQSDTATLFGVMAAYELLFWLSAALIVITGIGNLAVFHEALPGPATDWGGKLLVKLGLVLILLVLSGVRSSCLALTRNGASPQKGRNALTGLYGATVVFLAGIVGLAVSLSHF